MSETAPEIPVGVVIPAAGSGTRLGGKPKQFRLLGGKPLLVQTAAVFQRHPGIHAIVIVVRKDDASTVRRMVEDFGLTKISEIVTGGATRQESVRSGILSLPEQIGIVLTHDAVRPFLSTGEISSLVEAVRRSGAAAVAATVSDTLLRSDGGFAGEPVEREGLVRMLTPQGFRRDLLVRGHELAAAAGTTYTDEVTLVSAAGTRVELVDGNPLNFKITTALDWELAQRIWSAWQDQ